MQEREEEHFVGLVAQKAIIERKGKVLFVRSSKMGGKWDLPGGRLHLDEDLQESLRRELKEELGVTSCKIGELVYAGQFYHDAADKPCLFLTYQVSIPNDTSIAIPADELSAHSWLSLEECSGETVYRNCIRALESYVKDVVV